MDQLLQKLEQRKLIYKKEKKYEKTYNEYFKVHSFKNDIYKIDYLLNSPPKKPLTKEQEKQLQKEQEQIKLLE